MNKKLLLITLAVFLAVLGVAGALYPKLSAGMTPQQMATMPTATTAPTQPKAEESVETTQPPETTEPTESTEPESIAAPDFTVVDWDGNTVNFYDYIGKPIVLNFWTHWCYYCELEMPEFNATYERLNGEVIFLMVHADPNTEKAKQIVTDAGYTFPVVFDEEDVAAFTYGITSYPTTFFVDAEGNLQAYCSGAMDGDLLQQGIDMIYPGE